MPFLKVLTAVVIGIFILGVIFFLTRGERFEIPRGKTVSLKESDISIEEKMLSKSTAENIGNSDASGSGNVASFLGVSEAPAASSREIFVTDGVKHSIPLNEILSGGPPKDGIPSIDNPKFLSPEKADGFITDESIGLGVLLQGEARFYPYQVLVWHEIVNDSIQGNPILVTYCPLCATGITFDRRIDGEEVEFGVSGRLWQSNLLMYNRADKEENESLWSQVLGEAVLGEFTGVRLLVIPSDTVRWGDWKQKHPDTAVLSRDTGAIRSYGSDPYGDYYTDNTVSFGAIFSDDRLHPKEYVLGIELNGSYKAYVAKDLSEGKTTDTFAGETITIEKSDIGEVRMFVGVSQDPLPHVGGFWFSWVAVHPASALYGQ